MSTSLGTQIERTTEAITADGDMAKALVRATGALRAGCAVDVQVDGETLVFDMPVPLGGTELAPTPGQYALASLAACQAITYRIWSEKLGVRIDELRVGVRGQIDVRGLLGIDRRARRGFSHVDLDIVLRGPEPSERYENLRRVVNEHCPILDVFSAPVPVSSSITVEASDA